MSATGDLVRSARRLVNARRLALATTVALVATAVTAGVATVPPSASASATPKGIAASKPVKVKSASIWTLERTGTGCQNDSFGKRSRFAATASDGSGDSGTYRGSKHLTMTWKAGLDAGAVFSGTWRKADDDYSGSYSLAGQTADAALVPYVSGACLSGSSLTAHPTSPVIAPGHGDSDSATVYGSGGVTPTGTVAFYVCPGDSSSCTVAGAVTTLASVALTGSSGAATATSAVDTPASPGFYCFLAVYSGDNTYATSSDGSVADQCFDVSGGGAGAAASR